MRKLFYLATVFFFIVLLTGNCKKEDDESPLVGNWTSISTKVTTYLNNNFYSETTLASEPGHVMQILSNETGKFLTDNQVDGTFTWKVNDNRIVFNYSSGETSEMEYTLNDPTLTLTLTDSEGSGDYILKYIVVQVFSRN